MKCGRVLLANRKLGNDMWSCTVGEQKAWQRYVVMYCWRTESLAMICGHVLLANRKLGNDMWSCTVGEQKAWQ